MAQQLQRLIAACGGDTLKLFDVSVSIEGRGDPCVSHFVPSPGVQVNMVRWNHTNHVVASSGEDRKISLCLKGGKLLGSVPQPDIDAGDILDESILAINFSTKSSRYLCSGGTGKVVRIWDMQRKRCIKWLKGHLDTITGVMYNCKDEHLASISTRGDLIVYSLASGSRITEVKDPYNQVLRVLEYSRSSRHLLLTAGDDGSIHLWDTTGRNPKASWIKQHLAPTTGVCFSSCNEKVFVSVGLDKRLYTYDTSSRKPVNSISCDAPFSSLVFQDDGWTLAAGTNNGRVMFYDVRSKIQPLGVLRAFSPAEAVASLSWQHSNPVPISTSNWSPDVALLGSVGDDSVIMPDPLPASGLSSRNRGPSTKTFGRLSSAHTRTASAEETPTQSIWSNRGSFMLHASRNLSSGVDDMEVFSPLVDVQPIAPPLSSYMEGLSNTRKPLVQSPRAEKSQYVAVDERESQNLDRKQSRQEDQPSKSSSSSAVLATPGISSKSDKSPSVTPPEAWGGDGEKGPTRTQAANQRFGAASGTVSRAELFSGHAAEAEQSSRMLSYSKATETLPPIRSSPSDLSAKISGFPPGPNSPVRKGYLDRATVEKKAVNEEEMENGKGGISGSYSPGVNGSLHAASRASAQQGSSSFALQLVQRALEESLGSVQRALHEDVQNLHLDLLRQFHIQQTEMASVIDNLIAKQAEMMEEIQALRKENQQLRHLL